MRGARLELAAFGKGFSVAVAMAQAHQAVHKSDTACVVLGWSLVACAPLRRAHARPATLRHAPLRSTYEYS